MADYISQITLPDNETYNIKDAKASTRGIEYIRGTWAAASGAWTGVSQDEALYDGKQILLYMPFAGSGNATLNLTLANGTTTGPINVYYESTSRFTTHKGAYSQLHLIYHVNHNINGTNYTGWWYVANRDTNDTAYYIRRTYPNIKAGAGSVHPYSIIMQLSNGRWSSITSTAPNNPGASNVSPKATGKSANTNGFLLGHVLLMYANATYADGSNVGTYNIWSAHSGLIDARYSFNLENTEGKRFTGYASVYIVGTLDNGLFKLDTTQWWTQTLPSSDDGKLYIYIGDAYDWYRITFTEDHPIYWYKNGDIRLYGGASDYAVNAATATSLSAAPTITAAGTATVTLLENTNYTLTVGGQSIIFKTPTDTKNAAYGNLNTNGQIGQTSGWTLANGDGLVVFDSSNSNKLERTGITFDASDETKVLSKKGTWVAMYTHPTGAGNNHIPSGGSSGQFLKYSSSGVATWSALPTASTTAAGIIQIGNTAATAMAGNTTITNVSHTLGTTTEYYVTGSTTATTNTSGDTFDTGVYVTTTPGQLSATSYNINYDGNEKVTLKWNNADSSLDFIFV